MYRGDKDFRMGMELCRQQDVRYTALVPDVASPADSKFFNTERFPREGLPPLPSNLKIEYLKSKVVYFNRSNISLGGFFQWSSGYVGAIRRLRPDIIYENPYTTLTPRSYQTWFAARALGIPMVYIDPGDIPPKGAMKRAIQHFEGIVIRNASFIITYSKLGKDRFLREYNCSDEKVLVIPKPVDVSMFSPDKNRDETRAVLNAEGRFTVAYFGRLSNNKGCKHLLNVARMVKEKGMADDFLFLFVGGNIIEKDGLAVRQMKENYGLDNVIFTGKLPHREMVRYQAASDLVVYPDMSNLPGFATVVAESMAMGKAIVIGNKGYETATPIKDRENGRVVLAGDINELYETITELKADEGQRKKYQKAVRQFAEEKMDWSMQAKTYREIFERAINDRA